MPYQYELEIQLAATQKKVRLADKKGTIAEAIERYNSRSFEMQNPKTLTLKELSGDSMLLTLESALPLSSLGRALRTFSVILVKELRDADFISSVTANGQLFSTRRLSGGETEAQAVDYAGIEDLEVVKALMDYVYKKWEPDSGVYRKKRAAFERIKKIAYDAGMLG